jgi:hypothetical protein
MHSTAIGTGPSPARKPPVAGPALATTIQSLTLPRARPDAPVRRAATADLGQALAPGRPGELGEARVARRAERRADALRPVGIDHNPAGARVEDAHLQVLAGGLRVAHGLAEALHSHLEVHERALTPVALRDQRGVGDDPLLRVRRDVGRGLVHSSEAERERRREEGGLLLGRREVARLRGLAAHGPCELLAVRVDEAGLADARRVQLLQIAEVMRDLAETAALPAHLLRAGAGLAEDVGERRRVRGQQHDRARAGEVALERAAVLVGLGEQHPVERGGVAIVIELGHGERGRDEDHADDQGDEREQTHVGH